MQKYSPKISFPNDWAFLKPQNQNQSSNLGKMCGNVRYSQGPGGLGGPYLNVQFYNLAAAKFILPMLDLICFIVNVVVGLQTYSLGFVVCLVVAVLNLHGAIVSFISLCCPFKNPTIYGMSSCVLKYWLILQILTVWITISQWLYILLVHSSYYANYGYSSSGYEYDPYERRRNILNTSDISPLFLFVIGSLLIRCFFIYFTGSLVFIVSNDSQARAHVPNALGLGGGYDPGQPGYPQQDVEAGMSPVQNQPHQPAQTGGGGHVYAPGYPSQPTSTDQNLKGSSPPANN